MPLAAGLLLFTTGLETTAVAVGAGLASLPDESSLLYPPNRSMVDLVMQLYSDEVCFLQALGY